MGVIGAVGPLLVTGLIYVTAAAMWVDWTMLALGGGFLAAAAFLMWKKQG